MTGTKAGIPGLSFSWKRAFGLSHARHQVARRTGIPTTRAGVERKIGSLIVNAIAGFLSVRRSKR